MAQRTRRRYCRTFVEQDTIVMNDRKRGTFSSRIRNAIAVVSAHRSNSRHRHSQKTMESLLLELDHKGKRGMTTSQLMSRNSTDMRSKSGRTTHSEPSGGR